MVVECINCECYCHKGDANLPLNAELSDIKISPDVMYYCFRMVQVSLFDHDGSGDNWVLFHCFWHFQSDGSYTDEWIL
jgi:hypothetical protein